MGISQNNMPFTAINAPSYKRRVDSARTIKLPPGVPPGSDLEALRKECDSSLRRFCEVVFPQVFQLDWSPHHIRILDEIQKYIEEGGLKAIGMPRGSGKTSIMLRAALWAILTGNRRWVVFVAADEDSAVGNLVSIKTEINYNEQLKQLYERETQCLRSLENESRRATGQLFDGEPTHVEYSSRKIGFGSIPGSVSNGAVISTAGITGRIRGQQHVTKEGEIIRPDFVLCDDPQTKMSAASPSQCKKRHETMMGDVLGLAGPGVKISGFATCTVIYPNDLADRLLDRQISPSWNGDKVRMVETWPKDMEAWDEYHSIRVEEMTNGLGSERSRKYVIDNYEKLHDGAKVYWEDRKSSGDVSALHHAMDLFYRDQAIFAAEFQNAPTAEYANVPYDLNVEHLSRRVIGLPQGRIPKDTDKITAFIDVQRELLYYCVVAWAETGRAYVVDYGACPEQQRHHWSKAAVPYTLAQVFGDDFETFLRGGLDWLIKALLDNEYTTEDGALIQIEKLAIDARWGESTHIIRRLVRESRYRSRVHPSMGMFIGANSRPWQKLKAEKRDKKGVHAKLQTPKEGGRKELLYDTNYWKSFVADRLLCASSSKKAIMLFDAPPHKHRMFAEHCTAEEPMRVIGKADNEVVEWRIKGAQTGSRDNDYWDCLVGNCALASTLGIATHHGNRGDKQFSVAIQKVRSQKPSNQFFRKRK